MESIWTNGRILQQVFGHLQNYMAILYYLWIWCTKYLLSSQKKGRRLLHIVGNSQFWSENGRWPTAILNSAMYHIFLMYVIL